MASQEPVRGLDAFPESAYCPAFQATLELLGRRWTAALMRALFCGPLRFNEAGRLIPGISHRLLTERFAELQAAGLVVRCDSRATPVYSLTDQGRDLYDIFEAVEAWNRRWASEADTPSPARAARPQAGALAPE